MWKGQRWVSDVGKRAAVRILFHRGTSNAPTGSSKGAGVQVATGLKLILRCLLSGLASRLHGPSYSSIAVTLWLSDMMGNHSSASPLAQYWALRELDRELISRYWHKCRKVDVHNCLE
jgi:hypothetical protein